MATTVVKDGRKGARIAGLISIVAGAVLIVAGGITYGLVSSQLADENITVSEKTEDDPGALAGKKVQDPFTAYAQADAINTHALAGSNGKTYAELGAEIAELRAQGADDDDEQIAELTKQRTSVMNGSFLRASLFTSVVAFGVAALVIGLGVLFVLVGWALRSLAAPVVAAVDGVVGGRDPEVAQI